MQEKVHGSCLCGAVNYTINEKPLGMGFCYCRTCQKATGGAYLPFIAVSPNALDIVGETVEYVTVGESGKNVHRVFCPKCGATLFGRPDSMPYLRTISASSLDNPEYFKPQMQVWTKDAPTWVCINPAVPQFDENRK